MSVLTSQLDPRSTEFTDNVAYHRALVEELDRRLARAADGGGEKARNKHLIRVPGKHEINRIADRRPEMYGKLVEPK